ncbi:MAG TPA: hypothetical protein VK811_01825, partial [Candidatus Acidoferrum sp.]|nr:hypothetical protein [Candidatus Acidoferrum sp.]
AGFQRNLRGTQQFLAKVAVVIGAGRGLHFYELTTGSKILQHVVIDNNDDIDYIWGREVKQTDNELKKEFLCVSF